MCHRSCTLAQGFCTKLYTKSSFQTKKIKALRPKMKKKEFYHILKHAHRWRWKRSFSVFRKMLHTGICAFGWLPNHFFSKCAPFPKPWKNPRKRFSSSRTSLQLGRAFMCRSFTCNDWRLDDRKRSQDVNVYCLHWPVESVWQCPSR